MAGKLLNFHTIEYLQSKFLIRLPGYVLGTLQTNKMASYTAWKFQDFSITQILREINFGDFRSTQSANLTLLEAEIKQTSTFFKIGFT